MSAQVEGTSANGENKFAEWMRGHGLKSDLIQKLTQEIGSVEELSHIKDDEIDDIAKDMQLKTLHKSKLRYIVKKAKSEQSNNLFSVISSEEQEALITMTDKIEQIEKSMQNICKIQTNIDNEVINYTKQIESVCIDVINAVNKRKIELINKLNEIACDHKNKLNDKNKELNQQNSQSKKKLNDCRNMLRKPVDIQQMKSRKNNVLNLTKEVKNINVPNIQSDKYKINICMNKNELIKIINVFGNISNVSQPMLLSIDASKNPIKIKWKLKNLNGQQQNNNQKIKVEWMKNENENDEKEMKLNFNKNKSFVVNNYNNNENEILVNIGYKKGKYLFKLYYFDSRLWSAESNIKTIQYKGRMMTFNTEKHGNNLQFINGNIVKKINESSYWSTCLFGEQINSTMCNQFNIYIKLKQFQSGNVMFGYITSTIQNSVKNWNYYLGSGDNSQNSIAFYVYYGYNYFYESSKGSYNTLNWRAPNNFKQGDTFKLSFNFSNNQLIIYHNGTKAETRSLLDNCKQFTFAVCMRQQNNEVEITNYELL